jgi:hypothetical protein
MKLFNNISPVILHKIYTIQTFYLEKINKALKWVFPSNSAIIQNNIWLQNKSATIQNVRKEQCRLEVKQKDQHSLWNLHIAEWICVGH